MGKEKNSFWQLFRYGQHYMRSWPAEKKLAVIFPEPRAIKATRFAIRVMPPFAVFTLTWQIALHGLLPVAVVTALFACSLPLQGLWWLGKRSVTPLPQSLSHWFFQLRDKLSAMDVALTPIEPPVTYQSLADLLNLAFKRLDNDFLDEL